MAVHKSGLISENLSFWFKFPKKGVSYFPEHYPPREDIQDSDFVIFLNNFSESSEINPPLE